MSKCGLKMTPFEHALLMLLSVELTVVLALRGLSLHDYLATRDPVAGLAYLLGLAWFAAAPVVFHICGSGKVNLEANAGNEH